MQFQIGFSFMQVSFISCISIKLLLKLLLLLLISNIEKKRKWN